MKQRLLYIDNLKGILIILVVLGHCIQATDADFDHNIIFRYIYSFHMPMFMFVSGFVSYKPQMEWRTVRKRFQQLIVPFVAWTVLGACIHANWAMLYQVLLHPDNGLWFLWALFFIILALKICTAISEKTNIRQEYVVAIVCLVMIGMMVALKLKVFGFQFVAWYFPFYCMGHFGKKYESALADVEHRETWPCLLLFLTMAWFWMRKEPPTFMPDGSNVVFNYAWKFITAVVAIVAFTNLFKLYVNHKYLIINRLGGVTLGIYAIHQIVITIVLKYISQYIPGDWEYVLFIIVLWLAITAISYAVDCLLDKSKLTALLFLGKH